MPEMPKSLQLQADPLVQTFNPSATQEIEEQKQSTFEKRHQTSESFYDDIEVSDLLDQQPSRQKPTVQKLDLPSAASNRQVAEKVGTHLDRNRDRESSRDISPHSRSGVRDPEEHNRSKLEDLMNFLDNVDQAMPSSRSQLKVQPSVEYTQSDISRHNVSVMDPAEREALQRAKERLVELEIEREEHDKSFQIIQRLREKEKHELSQQISAIKE